jgi:hypothetical protein
MRIAWVGGFAPVDSEPRHAAAIICEGCAELRERQKPLIDTFVGF